MSWAEYYTAIMPNVYLDKRLKPSLRQRVIAAWLWSRPESRRRFGINCTARENGSMTTHWCVWRNQERRTGCGLRMSYWRRRSQRLCGLL